VAQRFDVAEDTPKYVLCFGRSRFYNGMLSNGRVVWGFDAQLAHTFTEEGAAAAVTELAALGYLVEPRLAVPKGDVLSSLALRAINTVFPNPILDVDACTLFVGELLKQLESAYGRAAHAAPTSCNCGGLPFFLPFPRLQSTQPVTRLLGSLTPSRLPCCSLQDACDTTWSTWSTTAGDERPQ